MAATLPVPSDHPNLPSPVRTSSVSDEFWAACLAWRSLDGSQTQEEAHAACDGLDRAIDRMAAADRSLPRLRAV